MSTSGQAQMLIEIQKLQFAAVELNLFLDTHPNDQQALALYNQVHHELKQHVEKYEQIYGPLLNYGYSRAIQNTWNWVENPWPWEIKY